MFVKMCNLLEQCCFQPLRWTTDLCTVRNLKYNFRMTVSRDDTSSTIDPLKSTLVDDVTFSPPCFAACSSLAMHSFSTIQNLTLKLVSSTYSLVASTNTTQCMHTSYIIIGSSNYPGDTWTFAVGTLRDCTTFFCGSSKDMLCISTSELSSRILVSP